VVRCGGAKMSDFVRNGQAMIAEKKRVAAELAAQYQEVIILRRDSQEQGVVIAPSTRTPGWYQVTTFDSRGFFSDYSKSTYTEAIYCAYTEGFRTVDMDMLERIGETPEFMAGCIWSMLPDEKKWAATV
jgi:hypothetical protein